MEIFYDAHHLNRLSVENDRLPKGRLLRALLLHHLSDKSLINQQGGFDIGGPLFIEKPAFLEAQLHHLEIIESHIESFYFSRLSLDHHHGILPASTNMIHRTCLFKDRRIGCQLVF